MEAINTIEQLREALRNAGKATENHEALFVELANALFNNYAIKHGDTIYRFVEIEFYHNKAMEPKESKKRTYPRTANAGEWFFHASGVDLCFESNSELYGGILIRSLKAGDEFILGPQRVCDTLFNNFDALSPLNPIAHIVEAKSDESFESVRFARFNYDDNDLKSPLLRFVLPEDMWPKDKSRIKVTNSETKKVSSYKYQAYPYGLAGK